MKLGNISSREILKNVYEVKEGKYSIVFSPFKDVVIKKTKRIPLTKVKKLLNSTPDTFKVPLPPSLPLVGTLDISRKCTFRCVYCSVNGGDNSGDMPKHIIKAAIDQLSKNAKRTKKEFSLVFTGAGEPTCRWDLLTYAVEYARTVSHRKRVKANFTLLTAGSLTTKKINYICKNFDRVVLSFDGPPKIQNTQRPLMSGKESFELVSKTAKLISKKARKFCIRATISKLNLNLLSLVRFFCQYKPNIIVLHPLYESGRALETGCKTPSIKKFAKNFIKAERYAQHNGIRLVYPWAEITKINPTFCHAWNGLGFSITHRGYISGCERVLDNKIKHSDFFIIGKYDEKNGKFQYFKRRYKAISKMKVENIKTCKNCFCRWSCAGGCVEEHLNKSRDPLGQRRTVQCNLTILLAWLRLMEKFKKNE